MKKKHLNITLTIFLIIIWGSVIYKYFGGNKASVKNVETISSAANYKQDYIMAKDTFSLKLIDRDPFGVSGRVVKRVESTKPVSSTKSIVKPAVKKSIVWPTIIYHGFVKGASNDTRMILLKIDNRLYRKREKETVNDITLVKAYNDSLTVLFNDNNKTIKKQ